MYNFDNPGAADPAALDADQRAAGRPGSCSRATRYFHRVDPEGQQLPYIDEVVLDVVADQLIPIKTGAGETDLQSRGLFFKHYTFLKESEERSELATHLWPTAHGRASGALPQSQRPGRGVARAVPRRALPARAVARHRSRRDQPDPVLRARHRRQQHGAAAEPALQARVPRYLGHLRSRAGQRPARRDRPDRALGRTACACCPTAGRWSWWSRPPARRASSPTSWSWSSEAWLNLGIKIHTRPSQREVFRNRIFSGETLMSIWYGLENGIPTRGHEPGRVRADQPAAAAVAEMGPVLRDQGPGRRGAGHAGGEGAARAVREVAAGAQRRGAAQDLGRRSWRSTATRCIRSR